MPHLLEDLVIDRVDLVDEGANSAAFIELYKRKEQGTKMEIKEILEKMAPEHAAVVQAEIDKLNGEVAKATELTEAATQELAKAQEDLKAATEESEESKSKGSAAFDETETLKAMPEAARELFTKMKAQKDAAEEEVRKAKEAEAQAVAVAKASELKALPIEQDKLVGILKNCSTELLDVFTVINSAMEGVVLGEVGKSKPGSATASSDAAWAKIEAKALEIAKADTEGITKAKAIAKAIEANPDLYKEYLEGGAN